MKNTFGNSVNYTLFGESHGEEIGIIIDGLAPGIEIDEELNMNCDRGVDVELTKPGAKVRTFVLPTNEEYMIALDTERIVNE